MTTNPPQADSASDDNKARAFFTACLTIGGGFAGLAVAGLVLGIDYLLHGQPDERQRLAEQRARQRRDRYADALAWLEADRLDRQRARKAKREWFERDPATRGDAPASGETIGRVLGRLWNNLIVGGHRFGKGWQQGREEAQQRRSSDDPSWWRRPKQDQPQGTTERTEDQQPPVDPPRPQPQEPTEPPAQGRPDDVVDAEIVPDEEPAPREVVPVGSGEPQLPPDPAMDDYQRRLNHLGDEVAATTAANGHPVTPAPLHAPLN